MSRSPIIGGRDCDSINSLTYEASLKEKLPKRVLHISAETKGKTKEAEEQLFMHYINEYELYDYLFLTIQEMFFNPQVPNPIPNISFKMEYQSYKFQLKEVPSERLKSLLNEPAPNQVLVHKTVKYQNIYAYTNEFMESQSLPPIIGLRDIILFTAVNECSSLKTYMDNLHWRKAITKANPNYEVADVFTINPVSLVSHASIVKRRYSEWMVNYDFIIKGPSFEKGTEVFYDIFLRYAQWLESVEDVHVLGFFEGPDAAQPFLDINSLLTNFNTPEPRTLLRNFFANKRRVMLKFISVVEGHFKIIGIYMNMHFLEGAKMKPQSLLTEAVLDNMVKVFFKPEDFILWNKLFPFDREETLNMLDNQIKYMKIVGKLNYAYKLEIIRASLDEDAKLLFKLFRGLFGTAEPFYLAAKEAEALKGAFEILEKVQSGDQVMKKLKLQDTLEFFADFMENLEKRLLVYHNYNIEGIHPKVLNILAKIQALYKPKADLAFDIALERIEKVILYCLSIGDSAYLSFEKNVFERGKLRVV